MKLLCLRYVKCDLISHTPLMRSKRLLGCFNRQRATFALSNSHSANSAKWRQRITYRFAIRKNWSKSIYQICWSELWRNTSESPVHSCRNFGWEGDLPESRWDIFVFFLNFLPYYYYYYLCFISLGKKSP